MHLRGGSIEKNVLKTITGRLVLPISNIGIEAGSGEAINLGRIV
jgi:hypothetical protein